MSNAELELMAKIGVFVGTVYGGAEEVAHEAVDLLIDKGHAAQMYLEPKLEDFLEYQHDVALVITSTTGQGEIPENLLPLFAALNDRFPLMPELRFGVIAMGDSSYGEERYCGAGRQFEVLLTELQAKPQVERLDVDACIHFDPMEVAMPWLEGLIEQLS
ncbi:flavodoxin [Photobacterium atrarenae]|uniref:Flavodoxin n=1 Tax=Photobacterium atrarenae TaxID=865757 RepID=A0ABY5GGG2_9GAMM|nr:flavodoxin [Photobacterium atrarenae]UTV28266.1 flavodoxin [Photobacterium atrarenae]